MKIIDYVWIGGKDELRSKIRIIYDDIENIPEWNYDGSSTYQADTDNSEVIIKPQRIFKCPFHKDNGYIVICDTYLPNGEPLPTNNRYNAKIIFDKYKNEIPWYGIEQEYFIYDNETNKPVGMSNKPQGQYYCSVGGQNAFSRNIVEEHLEACMYAGIKISGINAEVAPGQWEYQIGPVEGIDAADQLIASRYILEKITEKYNKYINYHPKPLEGNWNGSGCHTNFSTKIMREENGIKIIYESMEKLNKKHKEHMDIYGFDNFKRMSGEYETSNFNEMTYKVASRKASIRIPSDTYKNGKGYFEDRRPASNMDPYLVTSKILETIME